MDSQPSERSSKSRLPQFVRICSILLLFVLASSCKDSVKLFQPYAEPTEFRHAVLPLAIGNSWHYVDSANTDYSRFTDTISRFRVSNGLYWWTFGPGNSEVAIDNDTVVYVAGSGQVLPLYIPNPQPGDTVHLYWEFPWVGDVRVFTLQNPVTVPAGSFDNCAAYEINTGWSQFRYVFRPGVGVISYEWYPISDSSSIHRSVLFSYHLIH